jgi:site-specific DNA recombinase
MESTKNRNVVIYARVSTDQQEGGIDTQINSCNEYIQRNSLTLARIFIDEAMSGTTDDRKAFKELKIYLKNNEVDIVVFQPDRIARDITIWLEFVAICEEYNRAIHEVSVGKINTKSAVGQMTSKMRIVFAEFEKNLFMERSRAGAIRNMKEGRYIFRPPLGYSTVGKGKTSRIIINKSVAPILKEILLDYCDEKITVPEAVQIMKKAGIKTSKSAMHRIVMNEFYAGYYEYPAWGLGLTRGNHEAIVPLSIIQKIKERSTNRVKISKDEDFPLKTIMNCIECKRQLRTSKFKKGKFPYHYCKNESCSMKHKYISPKVLDEAILANLKTIRLDKKTKQILLYAVNKLLEDKIEIQKSKGKIIEQSIENNKQQMRLALMKIDTVNQIELVERFQKTYNECKKNIEGLEQELRLSLIGTVEPLKRQMETILDMLENLDLCYEKGDKQAKLSIVNLAYSNKISYDPLIKRLNLIYSDLIQELDTKNTPKGNLEVYSGHKLNQILELLIKNYAN